MRMESVFRTNYQAGILECTATGNSTAIHSYQDYYAAVSLMWWHHLQS